MSNGHKRFIGKISLTSSIVINVRTRASLAVETKGLLFLWLVHLNNKSNVCKQISFPIIPQQKRCYLCYFASNLFGNKGQFKRL